MFKKLVMIFCLALICGNVLAQDKYVESRITTIICNADGSTTHESILVIEKTYPNKKTTKSRTLKTTKRTVSFVGVSPNTRDMWIYHVTNHPEGVSVPYSVASLASMADLQRYHSNQHAGLHWSSDTIVAGLSSDIPVFYSHIRVFRRPFRSLFRR